MSSYLMIKRTEEELHLLSEEVQNVLSYCKERKTVIHQQLNAAMNTKEQYTKGLTALFQRMLEDVKLYECKVKAIFAKVDAISSPEATCNSDDDSDTSEDSSSGSDECDDF